MFSLNNTPAHLLKVFCFTFLLISLSGMQGNCASYNELFLWKNGSTLEIHFLNGSQDDMELVKDTALVWTQYANLHFNFHFRPPKEGEKSDIRIKFFGKMQNRGGWSYVGNRATKIPRSEPTMGLQPKKEMNYTKLSILHEFGHVLGFVHEHMSTTRPFTWNKDLISSYLRQAGYNDERMKVNYFDTDNFTTGCLFDSDSIMLYPLHGWALEQPIATSTHSFISELDKRVAGMAYPKGRNSPNNNTSTRTISHRLNFTKASIGKTDFFHVNTGLANLIHEKDGTHKSAGLMLSKATPPEDTAIRFTLPPGVVSSKIMFTIREKPTRKDNQLSNLYVVVNDIDYISVTDQRTPDDVSLAENSWNIRSALREGANTIRLVNTSTVPHWVGSIGLNFLLLQQNTENDISNTAKMGHILISQKVTEITGNAWNYSFDIRKLPSLIEKRMKNGYSVESLDYNPRNGVYTLLFTQRNPQIEQKAAFFEGSETGRKQARKFWDYISKNSMIETYHLFESLPEPFPSLHGSIASPIDSTLFRSGNYIFFSTAQELLHFLQTQGDGRKRVTHLNWWPGSFGWYVCYHTTKNDTRPRPRFFVAGTIQELLNKIEKERQESYFVSTLEYGEGEGLWFIQFLHKKDLGAESQRVTVVPDDDAWTYEFPLPAMEALWANHKGEYVTELVYGKVRE